MESRCSPYPSENSKGVSWYTSTVTTKMMMIIWMTLLHGVLLRVLQICETCSFPPIKSRPRSCSCVTAKGFDCERRTITGKSLGEKTEHQNPQQDHWPGKECLTLAHLRSILYRLQDSTSILTWDWESS